jgi:hypothetical protein
MLHLHERWTCARLWHAGGSELGQIQFLLERMPQGKRLKPHVRCRKKLQPVDERSPVVLRICDRPLRRSKRER